MPLSRTLKFPAFSGRSLTLVCDLIAPLVLVAIALSVMPVASTFEFDTDEGINVMKAFLYGQGYDLYTEIWNDQPPVLTLLLSQWFNWFGPSVHAARLLVLGFAALLVWVFYQLLAQTLGRGAALVGAALLILSRLFIKLSVSVMIGLPSLAIALLSIYVLTVHRRKPHLGWVILSGCLFALSLQTKLFTIFLIPLIILSSFKLPWPWGNSTDKRDYRPLYQALAWLGSLSIVFLTIGLATHSINYDQILQPHLAEQTTGGFEGKFDFVYLLGMITQDYDLALIALLSLVMVAVHRTQKDLLLPLSWLLTAFLLLAIHRPIWYHHYPLLAIPMAWIAAYGFAETVKYFRQQNWRADFQSRNLRACLLPSLLAIALLVAGLEAPSKIHAEWVRPIAQWRMVSIAERYSQQTRWVFTDRPMVAFYAGLPVPPEIAVFSNKRLVSGNLTNDEMLTILQTYEPEQVVLARVTDQLKADPAIRQYLNRNYVKIFTRPAPPSRTYPDAEHYLLRTLAPARLRNQPND